MGKRQQEADVTYNTVKRMVKDLYAIPTTQTLSTLARALGVAPAAVLAKVPEDTTTIDIGRVGTRGEERRLTMGPRDDSGRFSLRTIVGAFFLVSCLLHGHPSYRWAVQNAGERAASRLCRRKVMRKRKHHRSFKRKRRKHTSSHGISEENRLNFFPPTEEGEQRKIEFIASLFVGQTTGPDGQSEWDPEEDEEWVAYFEKRIQELEELQDAMEELPDEEIHQILIEQGVEGDRQRLLEQVIAAVRRQCTQELESLPLARDAQKLRIALRDEVRALCSQGSPITRCIPIPPHACRETLPSDDVQKLDWVTMTYCTEIWFMMADTYPDDSPVHLYLECPDGWYSAEVYEREERAEQEAQRRKGSGEGTFEVRYFQESDSVVLFTKHQPYVVAPPERPGE